MNSEMEFFTATCLNWQPLLRHDDRKQIIMDSLRFLVNDKRIWLYGFVIMPNHIHILWSKQEAWRAKNIQQIFLKFTAQKLKFHLLDTEAKAELNNYKSTQSDREYHFWERRPWKADMPNREVFGQKLNYIHLNPVRANLCLKEEDFLFSSASFYYNDNRHWDFLTHYMEHL